MLHSSRLLFVLFALLACQVLTIQPSRAHFTVGTEARVIHVARSHNGDGLKLYLRIPGPLAYAEALSKRQNRNEIVEAPFLKTELINGVPFYQLDQEAVRQKPEDFARFLASAYAFSIDGMSRMPTIGRAAFFAVEGHPEYDTPAGAALAFEVFEAQETAERAPLYIADVLFDLELTIPTQKADASLSIRNILPEMVLPPQILIDNLVLDHRYDPARAVRVSGQMIEPVTLDGSWMRSLGNFLWQGIIHILIGLDHVLFVVCLALASGLSRSILWSVTGFTLGHSVTLYLGSTGLVPQGVWFIPAIETAIAISILYAAILVILHLRKGNAGAMQLNYNLFVVAGIIGLVHGYGFSFVLGDLLGGETGQLWLALLGFNLGVELGQLAIVLLVFAVLWLTAHLHRWIPIGLSYTGAALAMGMALIWCWERSQTLSAMLGLDPLL